MEQRYAQIAALHPAAAQLNSLGEDGLGNVYASSDLLKLVNEDRDASGCGTTTKPEHIVNAARIAVHEVRR